MVINGFNAFITIFTVCFLYIDYIVDYFTCDGLKKMKETVICTMECVGKQAGALKDDGDMLDDKKDFRDKTNQFLVIADWQKEFSEEFSKSCEELVATQPREPEEGKCNPFAARYTYCMWRKFTLACPNSFMNNSKRCQKIRKSLEKGSYPQVRFNNEDLEHL